MKKKLIVMLGLVFSFGPFVAFAQLGGNTGGCSTVTQGTIQDIICRAGNVLDILIPILIVLGVVFFVYGVVMYMIGKDEEAKKKGKDKIIYGIIGLVVIVAMWGLVGIITRTFGLENSTVDITIPSLPINQL
ncbi:MAG: hypothetical protein ABH951_02430 [Patescibacteria group bacterium]